VITKQIQMTHNFFLLTFLAKSAILTIWLNHLDNFTLEKAMKTSIKTQPQQETIDTEQKILSAARQEFIKNGLRGARMQEIADRAGINKALLHYYFRDKNSLYRAAVKSVIDTVLNGIAPIFSEETQFRDSESVVRALVRSYILTLRNNPELVGMLMRELSDGGSHLEAFLPAIIPFANQISKSFQVQVRKDLAAANIPLPHLMLNIMSMIWGTFLLQPMYMKILPSMGIKINLDDAFYEQRILFITNMIIDSTFKRRS